jgi:hypothetical protein
MTLRTATLFGVLLVVGALAGVSLHGGSAAAQPNPNPAMVGRFQMLTQPLRPMPGGGPTVQIAILDTVTGRCWLTTDDIANQWRDLGSPPKPGN